VIPGTGFPSSANGRFPEASNPSLSYLFRGAPSRFSDIQWNDFQPRVGIAYGMNDKTVIRTGAGRFITRLGVSDSIFLGGNPPFQPTANVTGGSVDNPGGTSTNLLPLTVMTQSKAFKNPEAWNWNMTVERQFYWNTLLSVGMWAAAVCTCSAKPTSTSRPSPPCWPIPESTWTPCGRTRATTPFAKPTTSAPRLTTRCS
jgi:hypothetical protein